MLKVLTQNETVLLSGGQNQTNHTNAHTICEQVGLTQSQCTTVSSYFCYYTVSQFLPKQATGWQKPMVVAAQTTSIAVGYALANIYFGVAL